ncbi:hypothetical protein FEM48_Zijuj06G0057500 [Ziziphus jujuba var. spinosa]|uniref:Uncharacterized protein n=1 Tax=Ziziphus jujuba var. spinosa TaxID=714518 RepID=A0A978V7I2_ZIZJJ|nr:hypothetical protein FEM48_Zijuj06G0057500 [Ziziphus jujuba var. spinosa]
MKEEKDGEEIASPAKSFYIFYADLVSRLYLSFFFFFCVFSCNQQLIWYHGPESFEANPTKAIKQGCVYDCEGQVQSQHQQASSAGLFERKGGGRLNSSCIDSLHCYIGGGRGSGVRISPSLKSFLLSIAAGGVVVASIIGAVIEVSNFDPVK